MSRKYVKERISENFVYPNNTISEYDIEIVHDINDNSVSGTVVNFLCVLTPALFTVTFDYTYSLNGAERFINGNNQNHLLSVHMMEPNFTYYKPWRLIGHEETPNLTGTTFSGSVSYTTLPQDFQTGLSVFTAGEYVFEIRFIGHRAIFPVCVSTIENFITPTPTPTPTVTPTSVTPTPTPTVTPSITSTPTPTPTPIEIVVLNVGASMEPCVGGSIDDHMGAFVNVNTALGADTTFDLIVFYEDPPTTCTGPFTGATLTENITVSILQGDTSSNFDACTQGPFLVNGANICGVCINACSDPSINLSTFSC